MGVLKPLTGSVYYSTNVLFSDTCSVSFYGGVKRTLERFLTHEKGQQCECIKRGWHCWISLRKKYTPNAILTMSHIVVNQETCPICCKNLRDGSDVVAVHQKGADGQKPPTLGKTIWEICNYLREILLLNCNCICPYFLHKYACNQLL